MPDARSMSEPAIRLAQSREDYAAFAGLCSAYRDWCRVRYHDIPQFTDDVFNHQSLDAELEAIESIYGPPDARTMIAVLDDDIVAAGAWRRTSDAICELKRVFATERARGLGLGRRLTSALIDSAREQGFTTMQLDTGRLHVEALAMYEAMGFTRIAPYKAYPEHLMPHFVFMEKSILA
jgi:GNAT superfamily N-acetyltransferase